MTTRLLCILFLFSSCSSSAVKYGDEVLIQYSLKNLSGQRIDENILPSKKPMPLRLVAGKNQVLKAIDKNIIGMKEGETREFIISPEDAYGSQGVFYLDNTDTVYVIRPQEELKAIITILKK